MFSQDKKNGPFFTQMMYPISQRSNQYEIHVIFDFLKKIQVITTLVYLCKKVMYEQRKFLEGFKSVFCNSKSPNITKYRPKLFSSM